MPWNPPVIPVSDSVITVAWATANVVNTQNWLRQLTGGADPPGSGYSIESTGPTTTTWTQKVSRTGDTMTGDLVLNRANTAQPTIGYLILGNNSANYLGFDGAKHVVSTPQLRVQGGNVVLEGTRRVVLDSDAVHQWHILGDSTGFYVANLAGTSTPQLRLDANGLFYYDGTAFRKLWMETNDGAGSTLDADTVDGMHAADIIAAAASGGVPSGVIAIWLESMTPPAGWVAETTLYNLIPAGVNAAGNGTFGALGATGGGATHGHDLSNHAHDYNHTHGVSNHAHGSAALSITGATGNESNNGQSGGTGSSRADSPHTHGVGTLDVSGSTDPTGLTTNNLGTSPVNTGSPNTNATSIAANLPPYKAVLYIRKS